jgi:hypothetical protein
MNPFILGLMSLAGASNPDLLSQVMSSGGVPPPATGASPLDTAKLLMGMPQGDQLGALLNGPQSLQPTVQPSPVGPGLSAIGASPLAAGGLGGAGPAGAAASALSGLQGVTAPTAPNPVFSGGVAGGVDTPKGNALMGKVGSPMLDQLMMLLNGRTADPLRVPPLGSLLG